MVNIFLKIPNTCKKEGHRKTKIHTPETKTLTLKQFTGISGIIIIQNLSVYVAHENTSLIFNFQVSNDI